MGWLTRIHNSNCVFVGDLCPLMIIPYRSQSNEKRMVYIFYAQAPLKVVDSIIGLDSVLVVTKLQRASAAKQFQHYSMNILIFHDSVFTESAM